MERNDILVKAVLENVTIASKFGAKEYNVCELLQLGSESLSELYGQVSDLKEKSSKNTLLEKLKKKSSDSLKLEFKLTLIEEVAKILIEREEAKTKAKELREATNRKLANLKNAQDAKEIERINGLTQEQIDAEIAELTKE